MRLAALIGFPSVDDMLDQLSSLQLSEWLAYYQQEWLPTDRTEWLLATICALIVNALRSKKAKPARPVDFMPWADNNDSAMDRKSRNMADEIIALNELFGGNDMRNTS